MKKDWCILIKNKHTPWEFYLSDGNSLILAVTTEVCIQCGLFFSLNLLYNDFGEKTIINYDYEIPL